MNKRRRRKKGEEPTRVSANHWRHGTPDPMLRDVVEQLTSRRIQLGYSQLDIDRIAGLQLGYTAKYECGERLPSGQFLSWWTRACRARIAIVPDTGTAGPRGTHRADHAAKPTAPLE